MGDRIVMFDGPDASLEELRHADVAIDRDGFVFKDRDSVERRRATKEELDVAIVIDGDVDGPSMSIAATSEQITRWFSFGPDHCHEVDGRVIDDNVIVRVTAPDPRGVMLAVFGKKWCWEYDEPPEHPLMRDKSVLDVSIAVTDVVSE